MRLFEPFAWGLSVLGGCVGCLLIPALALLLLAVIPAGGLGTPAESLERVRGLLELSSLVPVVLAAAHLLVFWHAAHQLRSLMRDFGWPAVRVLSGLAYVGALAGGIWSAHALSVF